MPIPDHWGLHPGGDLLTVQVVNHETFRQCEGFDMANFESTLSGLLTFHVPKAESYGRFRRTIVNHLDLETQDVRIWTLITRENKTVRVNEPIDEDIMGSWSIERIRAMRMSSSPSLRLYLEVTADRSRNGGTGTYRRDAGSTLIFLKYFDISKQKLLAIGELYVQGSEKVRSLFERINKLMEWHPPKKLRLYEEIYPGWISEMKVWESFIDNEIQDGDIICFQAYLKAAEQKIMQTYCPELVVDAVRFYEELLDPSLRDSRLATVLKPPSRAFEFNVEPEESFGDSLKRLQESMGVLNKDLTKFKFMCIPQDDRSINAVANFSSLMTCTICLHLFVDPVVFTDCMHLACGACAVKLFDHSGACHQCRQPVRAIHDSHSMAAMTEAYCQLNPHHGRDVMEVTGLRLIYKPGQAITIKQDVAEAAEAGAVESSSEEPERPLSTSGCRCCNPGNEFGFLCPEPILDDDDNTTFPGHSRCVDCNVHLPLIPEYSSDCCAVCTRFTCHELGMRCNNTSLSSVPFSVQHLKHVRFPKKLDIGILDVIPVRHEREVLIKYAQDHSIGTQVLFETILRFRQGRGLQRASWQGIGRHPFQPYIVKEDDMVCYACARSLVSGNLVDWWQSAHRTLVSAHRPSCQFGISCPQALVDEHHAQAYNHMCSPINGSGPNSLRDSTSSFEGGSRTERNQIELDHPNPFPFSSSEVQSRGQEGEPTFLCSVVIQSQGVQVSVPGRVVLRADGAAAYYLRGDEELTHGGMVRLLFDTQNMHWVHTSRGQIPPGCRPVLGGLDTRDEDGAQELYHCAAWYKGRRVLGYTSRGMRCAHISLGVDGRTGRISDNYELLCWA